MPLRGSRQLPRQQWQQRRCQVCQLRTTSHRSLAPCYVQDRGARAPPPLQHLFDRQAALALALALCLHRHAARRRAALRLPLTRLLLMHPSMMCLAMTRLQPMLCAYDEARVSCHRCRRSTVVPVLPTPSDGRILCCIGLPSHAVAGGGWLIYRRQEPLATRTEFAHRSPRSSFVRIVCSMYLFAL